MTDFNAAPGFVPVQAPQISPPRISLLTAADVVEESGDGRWIGGHSYAPETCAGFLGEGPRAGNTGLISCEAVYAITPPDSSPIIEVDPFAIWAADKCSTWNRKERDYYGRARRNLLATEAYLIERELMLNTLGTNSPYILNPANSFVSMTTVAVSAMQALSRIERDGSATYRGRFLIHVRPNVLTLLVSAGVVRREGNVWLTPMDNIIASGAGYPGTGPEDEPVSTTSEWIYATEMVQIRRGPVFYTPEPAQKTDDNPQGIPTSAIDRSTNDIMVVANRIASVSLNPACGILAAEVNPSLSL